jgi:hypothetical protein
MKKFIKMHVKIFIYVKFLHDICRIQIYIKTKFIYVLRQKINFRASLRNWKNDFLA